MRSVWCADRRCSGVTKLFIQAWVAGVKATDMSIIVKDPMTSGGFGRSYTSYKVFTKPHEWAVRRRFRYSALIAPTVEP